ncbi:MAG: hypothetical protein EBU07_03490 [Betaproteobacteria bacterium]|jgi:hypothetical protein|nr:hypothetical protein [Betaproteobacteria bacterium]
MRFKLLRRRLTISAPRMAVRSSLAWPVRWVLMAIVLGFSGAIALWAFELGRDIAGVDGSSREELQQLRTEVQKLREERDKLLSVANTSSSFLTAEKAAQEKLIAQVRQLESDNRALRADLGFFERLIPATTGERIAIRGLQADPLNERQLKWQVLVMQAARNAPEFRGKLELGFSGTQAGRPWQASLPAPIDLTVRQYQRAEGVFDLPEQVVVKNVTVRVTEGQSVRAVQTLRL